MYNAIRKHNFKSKKPKLFFIYYSTELHKIFNIRIFFIFLQKTLCFRKILLVGNITVLIGSI